MLEKDIQKKVLDELKKLEKKYNLYYFRSGAGAIKTPNGYFKTGRPGCPDITVLLNGFFIGLEIKLPTGKQSDNQKQAEQTIKKAGGKYFIITSLSEFKEIIKGFL